MKTKNQHRKYHWFEAPRYYYARNDDNPAGKYRVFQCYMVRQDKMYFIGHGTLCYALLSEVKEKSLNPLPAIYCGLLNYEKKNGDVYIFRVDNGIDMLFKGSTRYVSLQSGNNTASVFEEQNGNSTYLCHGGISLSSLIQYIFEHTLVKSVIHYEIVARHNGDAWTTVGKFTEGQLSDFGVPVDANIVELEARKWSFANPGVRHVEIRSEVLLSRKAMIDNQLLLLKRDLTFNMGFSARDGVMDGMQLRYSEITYIYIDFFYGFMEIYEQRHTDDGEYKGDVLYFGELLTYNMIKKELDEYHSTKKK